MKLLNSISGKHCLEKAIVFGCGTSVTLFDKYKDSKIVTLGVNDIGGYISPTYNCIFDEPKAFSPERLATIKRTNSPIITNCTEWAELGKETYIVYFNGRETWHDFQRDNTIAYGIVSPYTACVVAHHLGIQTIGLLGVDFTPDHYNRKDGDHNQTYRGKEIDAEFGRLAEELWIRGTRLVNLSPTSLIESLGKVSIDEFMNSNVSHICYIFNTNKTKPFFTESINEKIRYK